MIILISLIVVVVFLIVINYKILKEMKSLSSDKKLDKLSRVLPENKDICKDMQKIVEHECEISLDDNTRASAYIFFSDKIILSNNKNSKKDFSRVLFIAHECIHSIQSKKMHIINFVFANLMYVYDIFLLLMILFNKASFELLGIGALVSFLHFYFRITLEIDAVYRSVWLSKEYLKNRNVDELIRRYEYIIPYSINGMYFSYIAPLLIKLLIFVILFLVI